MQEFKEKTEKNTEKLNKWELFKAWEMFTEMQSIPMVFNYGIAGGSKFNLNGNRITKVNNSWATLVGKEPLKKEGKYYFSISIIKTQSRWVYFGIINQDGCGSTYDVKTNAITYFVRDGYICSNGSNSNPYHPLVYEGDSIQIVLDWNKK